MERRDEVAKKWWGNHGLKKFQQKCDLVHDTKNIQLLKEISDIGIKRRHNLVYKPALKGFV
ncbi:hypothetical protein MFLO_13810 [Listeria floridensis FSL S10-1187]|uniref:Uncharacterized protein n=1 Tax=Listeria floridensis FSL S10-1187 TaxID=1265817 RepID=A0ABN0RCA4_9LIST|nr:hypothetical protein [Listeria floridensis]EUJ26952.1 hypothetical protein MFLO_13810 [Listeria floridensis FSL S10-1187]